MADYLAMNEFPGTGAIMQVAVSFAGNRPDDNSGTTPYFDPADVKGEIITPATATTVEVVEPVVLSLVNATTFKTDRIVPTGKVLRVTRNTMLSYPMVDFVDRQIVTENDLDVSSRQVLYAAMEALDRSNLSIKYARQGLTFAAQAVNSANTAIATANAATQVANAASDAAGAAVTAATTAVKTANEAKTSASKAQTAAEAAEVHATNVESLAARADAASAQALTTANEAKSIAAGIDAKATAAQQQAGDAVTTANADTATPEVIAAKATSAVSTANDASSKAASAKATAEGIDAKATAAQSTAEGASQVANQAAGTASEAKKTADGLAASVAKAQGDAQAANLAAQAASTNADSRVAKSGDTMTGTLTLPTVLAGSYRLDGNGLSRKEAGSGMYQLSGEAAYLSQFSYLYMTPKNNGNAHWWIKGPNDADRGLIYNEPDGQWVIRTAAQKTIVLRNNGVVDMDGRAFGGGKEFLRRGQTYSSDSNNVVTFASNGTNFGTDAGSEPFRITDGGNAAAAAVIAFLREGQFGAFFGLDNDNQWAVGGWSMGRRRFKLWHEGNFDPINYVGKGALNSEIALRVPADSIGSYGMFQTVDGNNRNPNDLIGGGGLRWASHNSVSGGAPNGTWRCCGFGNNAGVTLWQRVS